MSASWRRESRERRPISGLDSNARTIRSSLDERRGVIAEILAALQRIGRRPPRPHGAAGRCAAGGAHGHAAGRGLAGDARGAEALVADLTELARVRREIATELETASRDRALSQDRQRMTLLVEERQKRQVDTERARRRPPLPSLARADSLKDLIAKLEQDGGGPARAARRAAARRKDGAGVLASPQDPGRLAPAIAFAAAKGVLPLPVNKGQIREFGAADRLGGTEEGSPSPPGGAQVTPPCDGWVVYSGRFVPTVNS